MKKRFLLIILVVIMLMGSISGCKSEEPIVEEVPTEDLEEKPGEETTEVTEAPTQIPEKQYKEHITIGIDAKIATLDPMVLNNQITNILYNMTHNNLIGFNRETGEYEPELALSWQWIDDVTLELKLREGVVFHDGSTFNSYDVESTLSRANNALVTNHYDHSEIIDDYTIRTIIKAPNVDWIYTLSHNVTAATSKEAFEANPDLAHTGTGPWKVESTTAGDTIELIRNDAYWGELPKTKAITLRFYGEPSARLVALENNEIELAIAISDNELDYAMKNPDLVVDAFTSTNIIYFNFNLSKAPGNDKNLRLAVAYAINRDEIMAGVGDRFAKPATTFWGWDSFGYFDDFDLDLSFNPEKAKEFAALAESTSFSIYTSPLNNFNLTSQVIQEQLRKVGIEMSIQEMDNTGLSAETKWGANHDSVVYSIGLNPSGSDMFRLMGYGTAGNRTSLDDPKDPLYTLQALSVSTSDEGQRKEYLKQLQTWIHDEVYWIPLYYASANVAYRTGLENPGVQSNKVHEFSYIQMPID